MHILIFSCSADDYSSSFDFDPFTSWSRLQGPCLNALNKVSSLVAHLEVAITICPCSSSTGCPQDVIVCLGSTTCIHEQVLNDVWYKHYQPSITLFTTITTQLNLSHLTSPCPLALALALNLETTVTIHVHDATMTSCQSTINDHGTLNIDIDSDSDVCRAQQIHQRQLPESKLTLYSLFIIVAHLLLQLFGLANRTTVDFIAASSALLYSYFVQCLVMSTASSAKSLEALFASLSTCGLPQTPDVQSFIANLFAWPPRKSKHKYRLTIDEGTRKQVEQEARELSTWKYGFLWKMRPNQM